MTSHNLTDQDPLWVPLLTHYRPDGAIDVPRMSAHVASIKGSVTQIMLAGSTGDGWEMDDDRFDVLIDFAAREMPRDTKVMFGVLRSDTPAVIARLRHLAERVKGLPELEGRYAGATVCPPISPELGQEDIRAHYHRVLEESSSALAVYELPQVTGCRIAPETLAALAAQPRITMFKDSSGVDVIARSGHDFGSIMMVRGAEGGYYEAVTDSGGYSGWLLSTANAFPEALREIEASIRAETWQAAREHSDALSRLVERLFTAAADEGGANAFSNANRAADHLRAHGSMWHEAPPPRKIDGSEMSPCLLAAAAEICAPVLGLDEPGYLYAGRERGT